MRSNIVLLIAVLWLLQACDVNRSGLVEVQADGQATLAMEPPLLIAQVRAIDQNALSLTVSVDGEVIAMERDSDTGQWTGSSTIAANSSPTILVSWSESYQGRVLRLAQASQVLTVAADAPSAQAQFSNSDFNTAFDDDGDGHFNLAERNDDSDPLDASSPAEPLVTVPVTLRIDLPTYIDWTDQALLDQLHATATLNGTALTLTRNANQWTASGVATENSVSFVNVVLFSTESSNLRVATAQRNQNIGSGSEFVFDSNAYQAPLDDDMDGLSNAAEVGQGSNPYDSNSPPRNPCDISDFNAGCDTDTDSDGKPDSVETATADSDNDGTPNFQESSLIDNDGDGASLEVDANDNDACIPSTASSQCVALNIDTDGDGKKDVDEGDVDSDGDGILNRQESNLEDEDGDGVNDESDSANTDPCIPNENSQPCVSSRQDSDGDGKTDIEEGTTADTDGDGIANFLDSSINDADNDGVFDELDSDNNDPCIPATNNQSCAAQQLDTDGDGKTDVQETTTADADGDGQFDYQESSIVDSDNDGTFDELDSQNNNPCVPSTNNAACSAQTQDSDADGKTDVAETLTADTDGDGVFDYLDSAVLDTDSDGTFDELDSDNTDPCIPSTSNAACSAQTQDSDGDGKTDVAETLTADTDGDGVFDYLDSAILDTDSDGTFDELDSDNTDPCIPATSNAACSAQTQDSDGDGKTDVAETLTADTDGDGVFDYLDSATLDTDDDGTFDELDSDNDDPCVPAINNTACEESLPDDDGDGKSNAFETLTADTDSDGVFDYLDSAILDTDDDDIVDELDSDNDDPCVPDINNTACEESLPDDDGDGKSNAFETLTADTDTDGIFDYLESAVIDTDLDGVFDELDIDNADPCIPDALAAACPP